MQTFYWHDYETWGVNPSLDKPVQFAGIRTDFDFAVIGEPLNILCKPALDTVPHPEACLVTGITPQYAEQHGLEEHAFIAAIHRELAQPQTCTVGYNSIRFDDEVTRYGLYRNFYDPYAREWQAGNSRWDIIDMLRLCYALRPDGLAWPLRDDGVVSFKLEALSAANGLLHESAHDALSDVYATIALAKLVKQRQPKLFAHVFELRKKKNVEAELALGSGQPVLHISSRFGAELGCGSLVLPVARHPSNTNEILCVDLRYSPQPLFDCSVEQLAEYLYTPHQQLPSDIGRIPLKSIHINRAPIVLTPRLLDEPACERLSLDLNQCEVHRAALSAEPLLAKKLVDVFAHRQFDNGDRDVEQRLYDGFFSAADRDVMNTIPTADPKTLASSTYSFDDDRLPDLLFRYRARNFPESLSAAEHEEWLAFCRSRFERHDLDGKLAGIVNLREGDLTPNQHRVLDDLQAYLQDRRTI